MNKKLKDTPGFEESNERVLRVADIVGTISFLIELAQGKNGVDDIDSLANRRVRRVGGAKRKNFFYK